MAVTRKIYTFPGRSEFDEGDVVANAVPGNARYPGAAFAPVDAAVFTPTPSENLVSQPFDNSIRQLPLNINNRAVRAISLAPDSAIAECDIWLYGDAGEMSRHRVSAGNPCLTVRETDRAAVSIPDSIPCLDGDATTVVYWDAIRDIDCGAAMGGFDRIVGWPLKLELWQGDVLPIRSHRRAALVAHAAFDLPINVVRSLYVCVSGRRQTSVVVALDSPGITDSATVQCYAVGGMKDIAGSAIQDIASEILLPLNPAGDTSLTINQTTPAIIIEMDALARPLLRVKVTGGGESAASAQVHVRAED